VTGVAVRYLACEGHSWCTGGSVNGWVLVPVIVVFAALFITAIWIRAAGSKPRQAREAVTGVPFTRYVFPVRAVTPSGITVAMSCCRRGHATPARARAHAEHVAGRIRRTGR
jgi:hypothetical protein